MLISRGETLVFLCSPADISGANAGDKRWKKTCLQSRSQRQVSASQSQVFPSWRSQRPMSCVFRTGDVMMISTAWHWWPTGGSISKRSGESSSSPVAPFGSRDAKWQGKSSDLCFSLQLCHTHCITACTRPDYPVGSRSRLQVEKRPVGLRIHRDRASEAVSQTQERTSRDWPSTNQDEGEWTPVQPFPKGADSRAGHNWWREQGRSSERASFPSVQSRRDAELRP